MKSRQFDLSLFFTNLWIFNNLLFWLNKDNKYEKFLWNLPNQTDRSVAQNLFGYVVAG
jgi:hypothetical protein